LSGITVQLFGGDLVSAIDLNLDRDFSIVSRLIGVSPFTVTATPDPTMHSYADPEHSTARARLDISKDLSGQLRGAHADFLIIDNASAALTIAQLGTSWYTAASGEKSLLAQKIDDPNSDHKVVRPYLGKLSDELLANYERFIAVVLQHYPKDRIILLRSHVSDFYWDGRQVRPRTHVKEARAARLLLETLDDRLERTTGCTSIDLARRFLPRTDAAGDSLSLGRDFHLAVERAVTDLCREGTTPESRRPPNSFIFSEWAHRVAQAARPVSAAKVTRHLPKDGTRSIPDAMAIAALICTSPETDWTALARAIVSDVGSEPAWLTRDLFKRNLRVLEEYEFNFVDDAAETEPPSRVVVRLADEWHLVISDAPDEDCPIRLERIGRSENWDPRSFVDGGYRCTVAEIENVLESWWAYFERGRRRDTVPFQLVFRDRAELNESLCAIDFEDVLANERLCLTTGQGLPPDLSWTPIVDTAFLFDPLTRICCLRSGFGDQLFYYVYARYFADQLGLRLYIDDLLYDNDEMIAYTPHIRPDILPFTRAEGVFSDIFSRRLREARKRDIQVRRDNRSEYHALGLREMVLATDRMHLKACLDRKQYPTGLTVQVTDLDGYERLTTAPPGVLFLDVLAKQELLNYRLLEQKPLWEQAIHLPPVTSETSRTIEEQMLATDAIVIHIRRGDRVTLGMADSDDYYRSLVLRTATLDEYDDKHWFIFSDDLEYCRTHRTELGLDIAGTHLTFVEGNRHFASIDDFHLMALGKVIVCGKSGFSVCAALVSARAEYIFSKRYSLTPGKDYWQRKDFNEDPKRSRLATS